MKLAISSEAAPDFSLEQLADGCARRGIGVLHLVEGHGHGVALGSAPADIAACVRTLDAYGLAVAAIELPGESAHHPVAAARVCAALNCVVVTADAASAWCRAFASEGGTAVPRFELNAALGNVNDALGRDVASVPRHLILRGGGPEAAAYEGRGIGSLMASLTLGGYDGTLVLAPTAKAVVPVWKAWLGHGKGWGCGSKKADPSLVQMR